MKKTLEQEAREYEAREKRLGIERPDFLKKQFKNTEEMLKSIKESDEKRKKLKDPFAEGEKKYGSKTKMFKDSMNQLEKLSKKKK